MKYNLLFFFACLLASLQAQQPAPAVKGAAPLGAEKAGQKTGQTYAVVVGISDYQDKDIPDLRYADKDAEAFANFLRSPAGGSLDGDHLKVLINKDATMAQFASALDWLWEMSRDGDQAIIYFSGHGDVEKKSLTQPGFLLCWDAPSRVYMAGGAFSLPMLQEVISTLSIQNKTLVVVIADACHSGKLSGSEIYGAQLTGQNLARQYANEIKILSCQPNEVSLEGEQWGGGRGVFSFNLVEALYGLADRNSDRNVTLQEVSRYLEEHVTDEVAPVSQVPLVIGNRTTRLATVNEAVLASLSSGKSNRVPKLTSIEQRGVEDEVLAQADTSARLWYQLFLKALKEKMFLEPEDAPASPEPACAETYYQRLVADPQLARLHSTIRRNYAAALQDDAQQTMNEWLKLDVGQSAGGGGRTGGGQLPVKAFSKKIRYYPRCLERAAELLGRDHYMYNTLMGRKHFFEGYLLGNGNRNPSKETGEKALNEFRAALQWQPDMPAAYWQMCLVFAYQIPQPDSMEWYAKLAMESFPHWTKPYTTLAFCFSQRFKLFDRAKPYLDQALKMDSSSARVWNAKGVYHLWNNENKEAVHAFQRTVALDSTFADAYNNLGFAFANSRQYPEAEQALRKAIQLDSTNFLPFNTLGFLYNNTGRYEEAESFLKRGLENQASEAQLHLNLGITYYRTDRFAEAEQQFEKTIGLDSTWALAYNNLGNTYKALHRYDKAESCLLKALSIDSSIWTAHANLGFLYNKQRRWEASAEHASLALQKAKVASLFALIGNACTHLQARLHEAAPMLDKAKELDAELPDTYVYLAQLSLKNSQTEEAWRLLEQALELGLENGYLSYEELQSEPDFEEMRTNGKWKELMKKYFPEEP